MTILKADLANSGAASRRHHVAILFSDLSDSTGIAAMLEPETYADLLQSFRDVLTDIVGRHGGTVVRIDGDGAICLFGYPQSHEDAGRRATEAAIDVHEAAASLDQRLALNGCSVRLHSGIHAGLVLLREGDIVRGRFEMLGNATNVAARLCDAAAPGEIVVSESTLGADRHFFILSRPRGLIVSAQAGAIEVVTVSGRRPAATRFAARARAGLTPFKGRAAELARLRVWLADGSPNVLVVAGPPGIGKTRLIGEFLGEAEAAGAEIHRAYCEAYLGAPPLQPFTQLVRSLAGGSANVPEIAAAAGRKGNAEAELGRTIEVLRTLLADASDDRRSILAIDDWQWADRASRNTLYALTPVVPHVRFLLSSREVDVQLTAETAAELIELGPLSVAEAETAIAALLQTPDPFLAQRIGEASGGSPLFIEELCHASLCGLGGLARTGGNAWLDMLVQARFSALPDDEADVLRAASIVGHMVPVWLFTAITGCAPDDPVVAHLAAADFLFPSAVDGTLRFKHGITRDAIYRNIGLKARRDLHGRVVKALRTEAQRIGEPPLLDALAYHLAASGDDLGAVPYTIRAGDAALAAGALDRAQGHYRAAFEIVAGRGEDDGLAGQIWPLVNKYGLACIVDPSPDQLPVLREMAHRLEARGDGHARVRSEYWIGAIAYGLGESKQSVIHLTSALSAAAERGDFRSVTQIEVKLAQSLFAAGRYAEADALFNRVLETPASAEHVDGDSFVYALCCHGFLRADQGDFASADRRYAQAEAAQGRSPTPMLASYLTQRSAVHLFRGEWREALAQARLCVDACGRTRARYQAMMAKALGAYAEWQLNRDPRAIETLVGVARWFASGTSQQRTSLVYGWLAEIMVEIGRGDLARHYAARALGRVRRAGDRLGEGMALRAAAKLATPRGKLDAAQRYLAKAYRSATLRASLREESLTKFCEGEVALAQGQRERAHSLFASAEAGFSRMDLPCFKERAQALMAASR